MSPSSPTLNVLFSSPKDEHVVDADVGLCVGERTNSSSFDFVETTLRSYLVQVKFK